MRILSPLVFVVLQILFLPLVIVGVILVSYRQLVVSKRLGVSQTAIGVLNGRWTMHVFGLRGDDATVALAETVPNTSLLGLWLGLFPLYANYKISGNHWLYPRIPAEGSETMLDLVIARTIYFDRIIADAIGGMEQFVMLGAGYDTRAYGDLRREALTCFEVDEAATQQFKMAMLAKAGIDASHVQFVAVDFSTEALFERLTAAGYDPRKKTLYLWEGVTLYLSEQAVRKTMGDLRDNSAAGSTLVADIYAERFIEMGKKKMSSKVLEMTDEGLDFGLPFADDYQAVLREFIESERLTPGQTYFMGRASERGPFMVVASCSV